MNHTAVNWQGDLADLTTEQLKERADTLAWWIASDAVDPSGRWRRNLRVDPLRDFAAARDAWLARVTDSAR